MPSRKHIAFVTLGAVSHVNPSLALIRELVARGHRVSLAVSDRLSELAASTGAELVRHPSTLPPQDVAWPADLAGVLETRLFLNEAITVLPPLLNHYRHDPPDLVLYDIMAFAGPVLAARLGVPSVLLTPASVMWEGYEEEAANAAELQFLRESPMVQGYTRACNEWLRENGIMRDIWEWQADIPHALALFPRVLQPHADRVPATVEFVGPCLDPARLADRSWTPPAGTDKRILLICLGTTYNSRLDIWRSCLKAFADCDWHVVMGIGKRVDLVDLGPLPGNVEVHPNVPQLAVLATASAFITHGGMASCAEALWFGVPTIAIPTAADAFRNASMLEALGVGYQLNADELSAAALRSAVESLADSASVAARLAEVQAEVRAHGGASHAAAAVERFLG